MTAAALKALHVPGKPLVLPNAWDADTARLVEAAGFPVVATSSVAVASALGFPTVKRRRPGRCSPRRSASRTP